MQDHLWIIWYFGTNNKWSVWIACYSRSEARNIADELHFPTRVRKFIAA